MNPISYENINYTDSLMNAYPASKKNFRLELIAFFISVIFLVLLTAVLTFAFTEQQGGYQNQDQLTFVQTKTQTKSL